MRGAEGPIGPAGPPGQEGRPGPKGEPGEQGWLKICTCQRNEPAQVFYLSSGHWMSEKSQFGFHDVTAAQGEYNVNVVGPITYILHVGGEGLELTISSLYQLYAFTLSTLMRFCAQLPASTYLALVLGRARQYRSTAVLTEQRQREEPLRKTFSVFATCVSTEC